MNPWRRTRSELAGAWRSVRYDLDKRPGTGPAGPDHEPEQDATSTGMSTFGVPVADELSSGYDPVYERAPRRFAAAGAFGVLAVVGAAGSYFAVVNGLGSLLAEKPAGAEPYPLAAPAAGADATAGMGRGSARLPDVGTAGTTTTGAPSVLVVPTATPAQIQAMARPRTPRAAGAPPRRPNAPAPSVPGCDCLVPPVPTPTGPSPTPSPTDSPSASPAPSDTGSATPADPVDPTESHEGFVHSRRGRAY
jgi:hypothetical protein